MQWVGADPLVLDVVDPRKRTIGDGSIEQICGKYFRCRLAGGLLGDIRCRRRAGVPEMARRAVAAGPGHGRLAQDLRGGDARARARPDLAGPRVAGPAGRAAARPGRVRADAGRLHQGGEHRPARGAGEEAFRRPQPYAGGDRAEIRRARKHAAGDLGARDRVRRLQAAEGRHHRARHPGLLRPAQGHVPAGAALRAQDAGGGPHQARRYAELLGRRHGTDPVPAVGVLQARRRLRRRRQEGHLEFGARRARLRRATAPAQGLATRHPVGLRGARPARHRLHHRRSRAHAAGRRVAQAGLRSRLWRASRARRSLPNRRRCCCRKALTARLS